MADACNLNFVGTNEAMNALVDYFSSNSITIMEKLWGNPDQEESYFSEESALAESSGDPRAVVLLEEVTFLEEIPYPQDFSERLQQKESRQQSEIPQDPNLPTQNETFEDKSNEHE